jgi:NAD(P)-dependent dehydrogenase (short-subunit alcohol dehydrogenase family)
MGATPELAGRRVLVTGALSGIGAATCRAVVAREGTVAMLTRRRKRLESWPKSLVSAPRLCAATSPTISHSRQA